MGSAGAWLRKLSKWIDGQTKALNERAAQNAAAKHDEQVASAKAVADAAFRWPEVDGHIDVVGESYYQANIERLVGDHGSKSVRLKVTALIKPEDDNAHDDKAVGIWIDGYKVGHLDRDDARSFRRRLSQKKLSGQTTACSAFVMGGFILDNGKRASYGVQLFIKPFF